MASSQEITVTNLDGLGEGSDAFFEDVRGQLGEQPEEVFHGDSDIVEVEPVSQNLVDFYSTALRKNPSEVRDELASGMLPSLKRSTQERLDQISLEKAGNVVDRALEEQGDTALAAETILNEAQGFVFENVINPDLAVLLEESDSPATALEKRVIDRVFAAERIIESKRSKRSTGTGSSTGYFVDAIVNEGVQNLLGVTGIDTFEGASQLADLAVEASQLLFVNMSEEAFNKEFQSILDRVASSSFFTEDNPFVLDQFIGMMVEAGQGSSTKAARVFQGFDVATGIAPSVIRGIGSLRHIPSTMAKTSSKTNVLTTVTRSVDEGIDNAITTEGTSVSAIRPAKSDQEYFSAYELEASRQAEANNSVLQKIKKYDFGETLDREVLEAMRGSQLATIRERNLRWKRHEMDLDIVVDSLENLKGVVVLGKSGGTPFVSLSAAKKLAARVGGEVRTQVSEGRETFVILKEYNLPTEGIAKPTNLDEVTSGILSEVMSTTVRTASDLDARLKRGEAQLSRVMRDTKRRLNKARRQIKGIEQNQIDSILEELRDDPLFNWRREALSEGEFKERYLNKFGSEPREEVVDFYSLAIEINDTDYFFNADVLFKDAVNNGEFMTELDGTMFRAKAATGLDPETQVWDTSTDSFRKFSDFDPEKVVIHEIKDADFNPGGLGKVRYVVGNDLTTRRLFHTDVMPYNIGGHRRYLEESNFFLKQATETVLASGEKILSRPKAFMGVRLEKEALEAQTSINKVLDAIAEGKGTRFIDNLIAQTNNWNPSVENLDDFTTFFSDQGLDINKRVEFAGDGDPIPGDAFSSGDTLGNHFATSLNASKRRGTRPLVGFGGDPLEAVDPTKAIARGFSAAVARRSDQSYLFAAINGLLKAGDQAGAILNPKDLVGKTTRQQMEVAKFSTKTEIGKKLNAERRTIQFRLDSVTADTKLLRKTTRSLADWAYGKGSGGKLQKGLDSLASGDPIAFFRAGAFNLKLGLLAIDQVYVQASQLIQAVSIAGARNGTRGVLSIAPLRLALVGNLSEAATKRIATIQSPFTGLSPEDFTQLRDWVRHTGRDIVDKTVVEENVSAKLYDGVFSKVANVGRVPFNEGELIARLGAAATNFIEMRKAFPDADLFTDANIKKMIRRQDILTASMTSSSAARWQKSSLGLPFQFMTFHMRMMEQMFTKGVLTPAEKTRMILGQVMMFGASGAGLGYLMDKFAFENGTDAVPFNYELVRFGMLDAALSMITGGDTAVATRLAVGEGVFDFFTDVFQGEKSLPEAFGGPAGGIAADVWSSFKIFGGHVFQGKFNYVGSDFARLGRNATSFNRAYNFWYANRLGQYISRRTGQPFIKDLKTVDSYLMAAGIPLKEIQLSWTQIQLSKGSKEDLRTLADEVLRMDSTGSSLLDAGKDEQAGQVFEDMGKLLAPLTVWERKEVMKILRNNMTLPESIFNRAVTTGKTGLATEINRLMQE